MVWGVQSSGDADSRVAWSLVPPTRQEQQPLKQCLWASAVEHMLLYAGCRCQGLGGCLSHEVVVYHACDESGRGIREALARC